MSERLASYSGFSLLGACESWIGVKHKKKLNRVRGAGGCDISLLGKSSVPELLVFSHVWCGIGK